MNYHFNWAVDRIESMEAFERVRSSRTSAPQYRPLGDAFRWMWIPVAVRAAMAAGASGRPGRRQVGSAFGRVEQLFVEVPFLFDAIETFAQAVDSITEVLKRAGADLGPLIRGGRVIYLRDDLDTYLESPD